MEQLAVGPSAHFIDYLRFAVHGHSTLDVPPGARLREEGVERIVSDADRLFRRHLPGRLDAVLEVFQQCGKALLKSEATGLTDCLNIETIVNGPYCA
jgi:hypothetical protein